MQQHSRCTRILGYGNSLDLENGIRHLSGRDTSPRWMHTSHGVRLEASANRRGENVAVAITQFQRTQYLRLFY